MSALVSSFDPDADTRPTPRRRQEPNRDAVEIGALAIYAHITRTNDPDKLEQKWAERAKPRTRDDCRAMAAAVITATGGR